MRKISADHIIPVSSPPVKNGVVMVDDSGKIISLDQRENFDHAELETHRGIICPGFINAHCHLELSYMKGKIPEGKGLIQFIMDLIDYRNGFTLSPEEEHLEIIFDAIRTAENEMRTNGIVAVGDISNDTYTFEVKEKSDLQYHTFMECFGFYPDKSEKYFQQSLDVFRKAQAKNLSASITPHAPYSVSPELFELIFSFEENHPAIFSYHNQESEQENLFFKNQTGDFQKLFDHFQLPLSIFKPTGKNSLQSTIDFFPVNKKTLFVHNTVSDEDDFVLLSNRQSSIVNLQSQIVNPKSQFPNSFLCTCPNANLYIEKRLPDYSLWKNFEDRICIGTDSLASNHQLSVLDEMKTIQQRDKSLGTLQLLQWATINGANFFNWQNDLGSIEAGKKPGLNLVTDVTGDSFQLSPQSQVMKLV